MIRFFRRRAPRSRTRGEPTSGNGASSLHLIWEMPPDPLVAASVVLEVLRVPEVPRLCFWALQVTFAGPHGARGGAHLGLQWNPGFPGSTAANWGGYAPAEVGGLLQGSPSPLPSIRDDPNTRDFAWEPGRRYRLEVTPAPAPGPGVFAWRGAITDLASGRESVVRELHSQGGNLVAPMVWTESFSRCEHPGVAARWSEMQGRSVSGVAVRPGRVRVNYQSYAAGGCADTTARVDADGIVQATGAPRVVPQGALLVPPM